MQVANGYAILCIYSLCKQLYRKCISVFIYCGRLLLGWTILKTVFVTVKYVFHSPPKQFFLRCMECQRGLAMIKVSVRPSKACIVTKQKKRSVQIFIPYERSFTLVFWEEEWLVGATPSTWNFGSSSPRWSEIADFQSIFARSASALAKKISWH